MSKLNLIAIVTIIAAVSLIVGMAAPIFAQNVSNAGMAKANTSAMGLMNGTVMNNSSMPMSSSNSSMMMGNSTQ